MSQNLDDVKAKRFQFSSKKKATLAEHPTSIEPYYKDDTDYEKQLQSYKQKMFDFQSVLYGQAQHSVLVIFQGMDTSGKDSAVKHVMSGLNPQGCAVTAFKRPTENEMRQDFLWRCHLRVPPRGTLGIFNRSYYEDIIVPRVHPELLDSIRLPKELRNDKNFLKHRIEDTCHFESYLENQGVHIIKFFLHISYKEQAKRLLERIELKEKQWKFEAGDLDERKLWKKYQDAYSDCFLRTSTKGRPWYVVPADDKKNAHLIIAKELTRTFAKIPVAWPIGKTNKSDLDKMKKGLEAQLEKTSPDIGTL